jgi:hypothetical protein
MKVRKKKKDSVQIVKKVETYHVNKNFSFAYLTSLENEYNESMKELRQMGFFCGNQSDTGTHLFQRKNLTVLARKFLDPEDSITFYSLTFHEETLPLIDSIHYAEDLLQFSSHEYLAAVFGEKNVIKDIYYFSDTEIANCSVLFPKTSSQAVFLWDDQVNLSKQSYVIVGGNMSIQSAAAYDGIVGENVWRSKEGVYSGMSLISLVKLNGGNFSFYGKNATYPYMVVPENTGTLNFKKNRVVLGCLNPSGSPELNNSTVSAKDILNDNLGLYVFMLMILPSKAK